MVPVPAASGAMGTGWSCGNSSVCAGDFVSGSVCPSLRMLLWPNRQEAEEATKEVKAGWSHLDCEWKEVEKTESAF